MRLRGFIFVEFRFAFRRLCFQSTCFASFFAPSTPRVAMCKASRPFFSPPPLSLPILHHSISYLTIPYHITPYRYPSVTFAFHLSRRAPCAAPLTPRAIKRWTSWPSVCSARWRLRSRPARTCRACVYTAYYSLDLIVSDDNRIIQYFEFSMSVIHTVDYVACSLWVVRLLFFSIYFHFLSFWVLLFLRSQSLVFFRFISLQVLAALKAAIDAALGFVLPLCSDFP
jgi:hypothetical protein